MTRTFLPLLGLLLTFPLFSQQVNDVESNFDFPIVSTDKSSLKTNSVNFSSLELPKPASQSDKLNSKSENEESQTELMGTVEVAHQNLGTIKVNDFPLTYVPQLLGEPDLLRVIQNMPGVNSESDFSGRINVRGGRNDQNLILFEGVPIYSPWHFSDIFSAFNTEALESVELTKGVFSAQYGGRTSSLLDIKLQDGTDRNGVDYLTITPLTTTFSYGKPINNKTSFVFSMRTTYLGTLYNLSNLIYSDNDDEGKFKLKNKFKFLDFNAKVTHQFDSDSKLETSISLGKNKHVFNSTYIDKSENTNNYANDEYGWSNIMATSKLIKKSGPFESSTQIYASKYHSNFQKKFEGYKTAYPYLSFYTVYDDELGYSVSKKSFNDQYEQHFTDLGLLQDFTYAHNNNLTIYTGAQILTHLYSETLNDSYRLWGFPHDPNIESDANESNELFLNRMISYPINSNSVELNSYASAKITMGRLLILPGLRFQHYTLGNYSNLLPRLNITYNLTPRLYLNAAYGHFIQYMQTSTFDRYSGDYSVSDRWRWSNGELKPLFARTLTAGIGYNTPKLGTFSIDTYHKSARNLLQTPLYRYNRTLHANYIENEALISQGTDDTYGIEFLWQKPTGKIRGWIGYTQTWKTYAYPAFLNKSTNTIQTSAIDTDVLEL
jgi:hypothetical protein